MLGENKTEQVSQAEYYKYMSLAGGFFVHLVLGNFYLWGNVAPYITSWLRLTDATITNEQMMIIFVVS